MAISVIICTRNREGSIRHAVESVLANDHPDFNLVVVDQSDTDATASALQSIRASDSRLMYLHTTRIGKCAACNTAIACSKGEILAFTDDDCVVPSDWLRSIERAFAQAPDADLLYGQVLTPAELRDTPGVLPTLLIPERRRIGHASGFEVFGMGANAAARRRVFERIGPTDELLGPGLPLQAGEDFDLQFRVFRAGLVRLLEPDVKVDHHGIRSTTDWPKTLYGYGTGDGAFYMKHIRCGDLLAARLFAARLVGQGVRCVLKPLLGRAHSSSYLCGLVRGARDSFRFSIDRPQRLYVSR